MYGVLVQSPISWHFDNGAFGGNNRQFLVIFFSGGLYYSKTESNAEQGHIIFIQLTLFVIGTIDHWTLRDFYPILVVFGA